MTPGRADVIWFGEQPDDAVLLEYRQRDLRVVSADPANANQALTARAAVFAAASRGEEAIAKLIVANAPKLREFGLALEGVAVDDAAVQRLMAALIEHDFPLDSIRLREWPSGYRLAQDAARYDPGSAPSLSLPVSMFHNTEPPTARDKLLLQRAFSDCVGIELASLQGGRSDARVFSVHAARRGSYLGVRSQPLFAKIDEIGKVKREFENYRNFAEPYIPFGLRPNVRELVEGDGRAVLVGDFVDRSEALRDLIYRDVATHEMHMLYHETLAGWIDQGYARDPWVGSVAGLGEHGNLQTRAVQRKIC